LPTGFTRTYHVDSVLKRILGLHEHEMEGGKMRPEVVVYLKPEQIGDDSGAHCGGCIFFNSERSECLLTSPPACNSENGVCAAFLGGKSIFKAGDSPLKLLPKEQAGYTEQGPTKCDTCEYWEGGDKAEGSCAKVGGEIYRDGCCNYWEGDDEEE